MTRLRPGLVVTLLAVLVAIFMLMPLLSVVPVSFTPKRYLSIPTDELSWRHYLTLIEDREWIEGIWLSLRIGVLSATFATALATFSASAYGCSNRVLPGC